MQQKSTFITKVTRSELMCILSYEDSSPQLLIFPGRGDLHKFLLNLVSLC